jgi:hypothetical protein
MTPAAWFFGFVFVVASFGAYLSQKQSMYKCAATLLVLFTVVGCSVFVDAAVRDVVIVAREKGDVTAEFRHGVESLRDSLLALRWMLSLSALCMYFLVLFPKRHNTTLRD